MDRRRFPRVEAALPVRIWGLDAHSVPFIQMARVKNISNSGAEIHGLQRQVLPGEVLEVQFDGDKAQFRVVWAGKMGSRKEGEIGLERLNAEPYIWGFSLDYCSQAVAEV